MRNLIAILALLLMAVPAADAQVFKAGAGGIHTALSSNNADDNDDLSELFVEVEYQLPIGMYWLGIASGYDGANSNSLSLRWYFDFIGGNGAYPGIGVGFFELDKDLSNLLGKDTLFLGPELLFEFSIPVGEADIPAMAMLGYYPQISGEQGTGILRWGIRTDAPLFE